MGNIIRYIFKTQYRYSILDQALTLIAFIGLLNWIYAIYLLCYSK